MTRFFIAALALGLPLVATAQMISISISCSANGDISPKGNVSVLANSDLDVTATPFTGYRIFDWYVNGQAAGWDLSLRHFSFGDLDVTVYVLFTRITNLVHTTSGPSGQLSPGGNDGTVGVG